MLASFKVIYLVIIYLKLLFSTSDASATATVGCR